MFAVESEVMKSTIRKVLPNGLPSDAEIARMTQSEKEQLYEDQKLIIKLFRETAQRVVTGLQEKLQGYASGRPMLHETHSVEALPIKIAPPPQPRQREAPRARNRIAVNQEKPVERKVTKVKKTDLVKRLFRSTDEFPGITEKKEPRRQRGGNANHRPPFKVGHM